MSTNSITRRSFVSGAAAAGIATAARANAAMAAEGFTYADTVCWNAEYDVVVIGFGAAGANAAVYAADGGASVLVLEVAPRGEEGGNSHFAAQMACSGSDPDETFSYYRDGLNWKFEVDEELLRTYTDGLCQMPQLFSYMGNDDTFVWPGGATPVSPEYPELPGGNSIYMTFAHQGIYDGALWRMLRDNVTARSEFIDIWYESPAKHLVQDPQSKAVVGVEAERGGETVMVRARNGVVLCCGGFENDAQMIQDYLGAARLQPFGTLYNRGDGVRMAMEVAAQMWHMDAYESLGIYGGNCWAVEDGHRAKLEHAVTGTMSPLISIDNEIYGEGGIFLVGDDGSRFLDEYTGAKHGHVYSCGQWRNPIANYTPHMVCDEAQMEVLRERGYITPDREALIVSADTVEELAEKIGAKPEVLARTLADFNFYCECGRDYQLNRDPQTMRPLEGRLYAARFAPCVLNTQGGPRRDSQARILGLDGQPIPHLYGAGELGGICAFQYNSGGNLAECMIFGKIAGINAATPKDDLPAWRELQPVEPQISFVAGECDDEVAERTYEVGEGEYIGMARGMGDEVVVRVAYADGTIGSVEVVEHHETPEYGVKAIEQLPEAIVAANNPFVDVVAGATMTSSALMLAVSDAIAKA